MSSITPISFQTLEGLTRGKQIGSDIHTVQHSHLLIQNQQGSERISVDDYLLKQAQYPQLPHDTQIEIQLESGHTLHIPLQDLSQVGLQSAIKQASSGLNPQLAEQTHRATTPLLTKVRQGGTQVSGPEMLVQFIKLNFFDLSDFTTRNKRSF